MQRKRIPLKVEKGTGVMNDVDISWIPQETLNAMSKSTAERWGWSDARIWYWQFCLTDKASPKASPRKRANRAAGADQWERFLPSLYLKGTQHFWNLVFKLNSVLTMFALIQPAEASICSDKSRFNTNRTELQLVLKGALLSPRRREKIMTINLPIFRENKVIVQTVSPKRQVNPPPLYITTTTVPYLYVFVVPCRYSVLRTILRMIGFFCLFVCLKCGLKNVKYNFFRSANTVFWKTVIAIGSLFGAFSK